jgi:antitoxin (DNA-binding transcriptional repressor) of toxin-antitoxin stability system
MDEPEVMTATDASRGFSDLLHRVCYGGESFVIKKGNRLMARIVPVEEVVAPVQEADPAVDTATQEEADYYQTVVEHMRKAMLEVSE